MTRKAIYCSKCRARYHQDVDPLKPIVVAGCPQCGGPGVMIVSPDVYLVNLDSYHDPRCIVIDESLINKVVGGDTPGNKILCNSYTLHGYSLLGFHGCGLNSARSMMIDGVDPEKNTVGARGQGFYAGSLYTGLPKQWSIKAEGKGHGRRTIMAVYVKNFEALTYGRDYDWGKMDEEDDIATLGLEIVIFERALRWIKVLPAIVPTPGDMWTNCPRDSLGFQERQEFEEMRPQLTIAAAQFKLTYGQLVKLILDEKLTKEQKEVLKKLGLG